MIKLEQGISPAPEGHQRWSTRLKDIQAVIKERNIIVVKELTSGFVVDNKGEYWIFRRMPDGQIVPHNFKTIEKALDQIERVIEEKAGFQETVGRFTVKIAGQNEDLTKTGAFILKAGEQIRTLPPELRHEYIVEISEENLQKLENARNIHKKEAAEILRQIIVTGDKEAESAQKLKKAGSDVFQAVIDGIGIISGENIRLMSGLLWLDTWGRRSLDVRGLLVEHYRYIKDLNKAVRENKPRAEQERRYFGRGLIESLTRHQGIFWKIDHVEGNPFFKRFQSPEVKTLRTLPELVEGRDHDLIEKRLEAAVKKLRAIRRDWKRAEIRLTEKPARR